jgi:hypothetical protein
MAMNSKLTETLFVPSEWTDQIRKISAHKVASENALRARWQRGNLNAFDTRAGAGRFIINRAAENVREAEAALRKARARLAKCERKFGSF